MLLLVHGVLIENYRRWFLRLRPYSASQLVANTRFSVIIPARNEEQQIEQCLLSVLDQQYPTELYEVIVVDDFSTDNTASIVRVLQNKYSNLRLLQLQELLQEKQLNSYKKKAIEIAIRQATGDWIVTTDADCQVSNMWLKNFASFITRNNSVFVAAPVKYQHTGSFVSAFQSLDFMSLQGITAASVAAGFHSMCNGANLTYSKKVFNEVGGFKGIDNIASGDDMMLMHKIYLRYKTQVHFLFSKGAVVETQPMATWRDFFNQRIRWASKADKFDDKRIIAVLAFIYLLNLSFLVIPMLAIWHPVFWLYWIGLFATKTLIELRFMLPVAAFFEERKLLLWFPIMQPVHIVYTILAGWLGKFGKYSWKGRVVK